MANKFVIAVPLVAPIAVAAYWTYGNLKAKRTEQIMKDWTGVDATGNFHLANLKPVYGVIGVGIGIHLVAKYLGVNKMLAQAKVPFIRA